MKRLIFIIVILCPALAAVSPNTAATEHSADKGKIKKYFDTQIKKDIDYDVLSVFAEGTPVVYQTMGEHVNLFFTDNKDKPRTNFNRVSYNCFYDINFASCYEQKATLFYQGKESENFSLLAGENTGLGTRPNSGYSQTYFQSNWQTKIKNELAVNYHLSLYNNNYGLPGPLPPAGQKGQFSDNYDASSLTDHFQEEDKTAGAVLKYFPASNKELSATLRYKNYRTKSKLLTQIKSSGTLFDTYTLTTIDRITNKLAYSDLSCDWFVYSCGLDYEHDQVYSSYQKRDTNNLKITELNFKTLGNTTLWGELELFKNNCLEIFYGNRLKKHNLYPEQYAQEIGCSLSILKDLKFNLIKRNYNNVPDINSLYYPDYGNEKLAPEKIEEQRVGFSWQNKNLKLNYEVLQQDIDDIIMSVPSNNGRYYARNISQAEINGEKLNFYWELIENNLWLDGTIIKQKGTYTRLKRQQYYNPYGTEIIEDEQLPDFPEEKSVFGICGWVTKRLFCRLDTLYVARRINYYEKLGTPPFDPNVYTIIKEQNPYRLWNCYLNFQFNDYLLLYLNFLNFTNTRYKTAFGEQSADGYFDGDYPGSGSNVTIGAKGVF